MPTPPGMRTLRLSAFGASLTLHLLAGILVISFASAVTRRPDVAGEAGRAMAVFAVPPPEDATLPGLNAVDPTRDESMIRRAGESSALSIPGFTFDFKKVADRATLLFPFLTPGLSLEHFALTPAREVSDGSRSWLVPVLAGQAQSALPRPALVLSDDKLQALVDEAWSRRDRWSVFQRMAALAERYSPDAGKLPDVFHAYLEQDGLQPYVDQEIRDPRLWTELGLAADHVPFVGFIRRYASEHPSTRTTTELLFLLDKLVQASFDALVTLLDSNPTLDLSWTRQANRGAYDLLVQIRHYYQAQIERKGLKPTGALAGHYDRVRLAILTGILRTTPHGYRASDARFLIGAIYWKQQNAAAALQSWREMTVDPTDNYVTAYSGLLPVIRAAANGQPLDARQVGRILDNEYGRWIGSSFDRLRRFGYRFDTF